MHRPRKQTRRVRQGGSEGEAMRDKCARWRTPARMSDAVAGEAGRGPAVTAALPWRKAAREREAAGDARTKRVSTPHVWTLWQAKGGEAPVDAELDSLKVTGKWRRRWESANAAKNETSNPLRPRICLGVRTLGQQERVRLRLAVFASNAGGRLHDIQRRAVRTPCAGWRCPTRWLPAPARRRSRRRS